MNILEEFRYSILDPAEYDACPSQEYKEPLPLITLNKEKLLAAMTDSQKELFPDIQTVQGSFRLWLSICCSRTAIGSTLK